MTVLVALTVITPPQEVTSVREVAGYAAFFIAAAALIAPPPVVAAAEYTTGVHQEELAIAEAQVRFVRGTAPDSHPRPPPKTLITLALEDQASYLPQYGTLWGMQPFGIDTKPPHTRFAAPEHFDDPTLGKGTVWGAQPGTLFVQVYTLVAGPESGAYNINDDGYGLLWGMQPFGIDVQPPHTIQAAPEQLDFDGYAIQPYISRWGPQPGTLEVQVQPFIFAPEQADLVSYGLVWSMLLRGNPPTVTLSALPTSITAWLTSTLTWTTTGATTITASGGWSGSKAVSGSEVTTPLGVTTIFYLTATNSDGSAVASATVTVTGTSPVTPTPGTSTEVRPGGRAIVATRRGTSSTAFDFTSVVKEYDAITAQTVTISVYTGVDASPNSVLIGSPTLSGRVVTQQVGEGVIGVVYKILCHVTTTSGRTPEMSAYYTAMQSRRL